MRGTAAVAPGPVRLRPWQERRFYASLDEIETEIETETEIEVVDRPGPDLLPTTTSVAACTR